MLVSIDRIRKALNISSVDSSKDNILIEYEATARNFIETYCDQPIIEINKDILIDGDNSNRIFLSYSQATLINSVSRRADDFMIWEALNINDFVLIHNIANYIYCKDKLEFDYTYKFNIKIGYDVIPETIQNVALEIIYTLYKQYELGTVDEGNKNITNANGQTMSIQKIDLTNKHKSMLKPYKRYVV